MKDCALTSNGSETSSTNIDFLSMAYANEVRSQRGVREKRSQEGRLEVDSRWSRWPTRQGHWRLRPFHIRVLMIDLLILCASVSLSKPILCSRGAESLGACILFWILRARIRGWVYVTNGTKFISEVAET